MICAWFQNLQFFSPSTGGVSVRGRYSHVAAVMEGRVLLVAGGYSGIARGDLVAYKVPLFVSSDQGDRVSVSNGKQEIPTMREVTGQLCTCVCVFSTRMLFVLRLWMKACA